MASLLSVIIQAVGGCRLAEFTPRPKVIVVNTLFESMQRSGLNVSDIPPIYVSSSGYDDMGAILDRLDISYSPVNDVDLAFQNDGIVLLNCSFSWDDEIDLDSLEQFVNTGGTLMASDLTSRAITHFTNASFQSGDWGNSVQATVEDPELVELLGQDSLELDFDTAIEEPTRLPANSEPLLRAANRDSVIAYKFSYGQGKVIYTVFHNHSQSTEVEDALLQALLMVPIAESTNSTVTETYTTIVGSEESANDTELLDSSTGEPTEIFQEPSSGGTAVDNTASAFTVELSVVSGGQGSISETIPPNESVQFGRADFNGVVDEEHRQYISSRHFEIRHDGEPGTTSLELQDTDSTNGTKLAGSKIPKHTYHSLEPGDQVSLANERVTLSAQFIDPHDQ